MLYSFLGQRSLDDQGTAEESFRDNILSRIETLLCTEPILFKLGRQQACRSRFRYRWCALIPEHRRQSRLVMLVTSRLEMSFVEGWVVQVCSLLSSSFFPRNLHLSLSSETMSERPLAETLVRHPTLWLDDGNVVLVVENTGFRVHRGILSKHSDVFRDMFSVPQPPAGTSSEK